MDKNNTFEICTKVESNDIIIYTVKDLPNIFKCSLSQAYNLVNASGFPVIRIGGKILVEKRALESWIAKNKGKRIALD